MFNAVLTAKAAIVRTSTGCEAWLWWRSTDLLRTVEGGQRYVHAPLCK
jgi:hypothetical protein